MGNNEANYEGKNKDGQRFIQMTQTPIPRLIPKLAVPTIISMLVTSIYNMADTFFVSQIGTSASAAVGVIFSVMALFQAVGFTLGVGGGNYISRSLGNQDHEQAEKIAATSFFTALLFGIVIAILGALFLDDIIRVLGATETIAPYAKNYAAYIFFGAPFIISSFVMNNILRSQGNAFYSMLAITTGGVLNIILDPIFIFVLDMGIAGAAIATLISQVISFSILFYQSNFRKNSIKLKLKNFTPTLKMYGSILNGGMPSFWRQGLASISTIILNLAAAPFGDGAIAALSIVTRFMMFINSALIGFGQGFQPVCGFNYGAKRYDRVLEAFWFCIKVAVSGMIFLGLASLIFSRQIITVFRRNDLEVIAIGVLALRMQLCTLPLQATVIIFNMLAQSIGYGVRASLISMGRQGLFLIPALLLLPPALGLFGLQLAQPVADLCTFTMAIFIGLRLLREIKGLQQAQDLPSLKISQTKVS